MTLQDDMNRIGKEYNELAKFIAKEIFKTNNIQVGYDIIKKFGQAGWIWSKEE